MTSDPPISRWKRAWNAWLRIAAIIGDFQARVILSLFYFIIVLPFGLLVRIFADPLGVKGQRPTTWTPFTNRTQTLDQAARQA